MNVTIKQLQAFSAVAKSKSFAEACDQLNLSQPALSIAIKNLEEAVGGKLLDRSTRSVSLTPEGEAFFPEVQRLISDWDRSLENARNVFSLQRGKLEIAAMPTFASNLLPTIVATFHNQYPEINVTVHDVIAESVVDMVRNKRAELGITFEPSETSELNFQPLFRDRFVAVLPKEHPLLAKAQLKWNDLQPLPFIGLQHPSSIRALIDQILQQHNIVLRPSFEAHQLATIGRMVTTGLGVSVVPSLSSLQMNEMGALCRPLTGPVITRNVGIITRVRSNLSIAGLAMMDVIDRWNSQRASPP